MSKYEPYGPHMSSVDSSMSKMPWWIRLSFGFVQGLGTLSLRQIAQSAKRTRAIVHAHGQGYSSSTLGER